MNITNIIRGRSRRTVSNKLLNNILKSMRYKPKRDFEDDEDKQHSITDFYTLSDSGHWAFMRHCRLELIFTI